MTVLSAQVMRDLWLRNGGDPAQTIIALAVSRAESGWNTTAVSPSADYGLWQINRIHFGEFNVDASSVEVPDTNAKIAVTLSASGFNWAPWCTCWLDPKDNCGNGLLRAPQTGSPANLQIPYVEQVLGQSGPYAGLPQTDDPTVSLMQKWGLLQYTFGTWFSTAETAELQLQQQARGLIG